jgi:hypothetical protein
MKSNLGNSILGTLLLLLSYQQLSGMQIEVSERQLIREAESIVLGTVVGQHSYWNDENTLIYTDFTIRVEHQLKDVGSDSLIIVNVIGGEVDDVGLKVSNEASLTIGERILLFLKAADEIRMKIIRGDQGKSTITNDIIEKSGEDIKSFMRRTFNK